MKKRLMISVCVTAICLSGCDIPFLPQVKNIKGTSEEERQFLRVPRESMQVTLEPTQLEEKNGSMVAHTRVVIANVSKQEIPLRTDGNVLLHVVARDEKGLKMFERELTNDKKTLKPDEQMTWDMDMTLLKPGAYSWDVQMMLKSGELTNKKNEIILYHELTQEWQQNFQWNAAQHRFLPQVKQVYSYQTDQGEEWEQEFQYFVNGFVQSDDHNVGTTIYYEDGTGLYLAQVEDGQHDAQSQLVNPPATKTLLLPFPADQGKKWQVGGVTYQIVDTNVAVRTKAQIFPNAIVVEVNKEPKTRLYYQESVGLVRTDIEVDGKWKESMSLAAIK